MSSRVNPGTSSSEGFEDEFLRDRTLNKSPIAARTGSSSMIVNSKNYPW